MELGVIQSAIERVEILLLLEENAKVECGSDGKGISSIYALVHDKVCYLKGIYENENGMSANKLLSGNNFMFSLLEYTVTFRKKFRF